MLFHTRTLRAPACRTVAYPAEGLFGSGHPGTCLRADRETRGVLCDTEARLEASCIQADELAPKGARAREGGENPVLMMLAFRDTSVLDSFGTDTAVRPPRVG